MLEYISRAIFIDYYLKLNNKYKDIVDLINEGYLTTYIMPNSSIGIKIPDCIYGIKFKTRIGRIPLKREEILNWIPKMYKPTYEISQDEFYEKFGFVGDNREKIFRELIQEDIIKFNSHDFRTFICIKCCDTKNYKEILLRYIPKDVDKDWFYNFKEEYYISYFIDDYKKSKIYLDNHINEININEDPIIINKNNIDIIKNKSIVCDLYDVDENKSIYVFENRDGNNEIEAILFHIDKNIDKTKK